MTSLANQVQNQAYRIINLQLFFVLLVSILTQIIFRHPYGISIAAGGLTYCLPNFLLVWLAFRFAGAQQVVYFLAAFMLGETLKLILCGLFFVIIVKYLPISLSSVVGGLGLSMLSFWIACIWRLSAPKKKTLT